MLGRASELLLNSKNHIRAGRLNELVSKMYSSEMNMNQLMNHNYLLSAWS